MTKAQMQKEINRLNSALRNVLVVMEHECGCNRENGEECMNCEPIRRIEAALRGEDK